MNGVKRFREAEITNALVIFGSCGATGDGREEVETRCVVGGGKPRGDGLPPPPQAVDRLSAAAGDGLRIDDTCLGDLTKLVDNRRKVSLT